MISSLLSACSASSGSSITTSSSVCPSSRHIGCLRHIRCWSHFIQLIVVVHLPIIVCSKIYKTGVSMGRSLFNNGFTVADKCNITSFQSKPDWLRTLALYTSCRGLPIPSEQCHIGCPTSLCYQVSTGYLQFLTSSRFYFHGYLSGWIDVFGWSCCNIFLNFLIQLIGVPLQNCELEFPSFDFQQALPIKITQFFNSVTVRESYLADYLWCLSGPFFWWWWYFLL